MIIFCLQADILVNSAASDSSDLSSCGEVSKHFLLEGGDQLAEEYKQHGGIKPGDTWLSQGKHGRLQCKHVLHIGIQKWKAHMETEVTNEWLFWYRYVFILNFVYLQVIYTR